MKILLSNDDGIDAPGLAALLRAFADDEIFVCAPKSEQSGMAHAMTVHRPIEFGEREDICAMGAQKAFFVDGTPTDCVKAFLEFLSPEEIDAVVSGINNGANLGTDIIYSGTVGAALEGFLHDIDSFAVSLERESDIPLDEAARAAAAFIRRRCQKKSAQPQLLNINFPRHAPQGEFRFKPTVAGRREYTNVFSAHTQNDGRKYLAIHGEIFDRDNGDDTDIFAVGQGFVSVSRLHAKVADRSFLSNEL